MTEQSTNRRYDNLYQSKATIVTSATLPTTGSRDGDLIQYKALATFTGANQNAIWTFIYSASDAYWYPIAATPLVATDGGNFASSSTSTWQDSVTPKLKIPLAGDYTITTNATCAMATSTASAAFGPNRSAALPPLGFAIIAISANTNAPLPWVSDFSVVNALACSVGDQFSGIAWTDNATPARAVFSERRVSITPLRVH